MLLAKWTPQRLDKETSDVSQGSESCTEAINFLFERGVAKTRPRTRGLAGAFESSQKVDYAKSLLLNSSNKYLLYIQSNGTIRRVASTDSETSYSGVEITGAGTTFGSRLYHNITVWNGIVLIGNNTGGLLTHTPISTTTYAIASDAKYRFFTTSFNRAVGAFDITSGSNDPRKIGWSTTTDVTDWTSEGSGSTILTDIPDDITGVANLNNVIAVARTSGWTLGYVTGSNTTGPFRWELMVREGPGCNWPATLATYGSTVYCVGLEDVYSFDINKGPVPIGGEIRDALIQSIQAGARYRGVIVRGDGVGLTEAEEGHCLPRLRYHLVPIVPTEGARHYCYDIKEKRWSSHAYSTTIRDGFELQKSPPRHTLFSLTLLDDVVSPSLYEWIYGRESSIDEDAILRSPVFLLNESGEFDMDVKSLLVVWRLEDPATTDLPPAKLILTLQQEYRTVSETIALDLAKKISNRVGEWNMTWFRHRQTGNLLSMQLVVPAKLQLAIKQIEVHGEQSAESRAA